MHTVAEASAGAEVTVADILALTVARLLNLIPGIRFETAIIEDLIQMIGDLGDLKQHDVFKSDEARVDIVLFPSTTYESDVANTTEFLVPLPSLEIVAVLESTMACILSLFVSYRRSSQLYPADDCTEVLRHGAEPSNSYFPGLTRDPTLISDLVSSLHQILSRVMWFDGQGSVQIQSQRAALASLKLSYFLLMDCDSGSLHLSVKMQVGLMVVKATFSYLAAASSGSAFINCDSTQQAYAKGLCRLMQRIFVVNLHNSTEEVSSLCSTQKAAFPVLVGCLQFLYKTGRPDSVLTHRELTKAVLESLWNISGLSPAFCINRFESFSCLGSDDCSRNLFRAIHDPELAALVAPFLLSTIEENPSQWYSRIIEVCCSVLGSKFPSQRCHSEADLLPHESLTRDENDYVTDCIVSRGGSKRLKTSSFGEYESLWGKRLLQFILETVALVSSDTSPRSDFGPCGVTIFLMMLLVASRYKAENYVHILLEATVASLKYVTSRVKERNHYLSLNGDLVILVLRSIVSIGNANTAVFQEIQSLMDALASAEAPSSSINATAENERRRVIASSLFQHEAVKHHQGLRLKTLRTLLGLNSSTSDLQTLRTAFSAQDTRTRSIALESVSFLLQNSSSDEEMRRFIRISCCEVSPVSEDSSALAFFLESALGEKNSRLRDYASREFGKALLSNNPCTLLIAFAQDDELALLVDSEKRNHSVSYAKLMQSCGTRFYHLIDNFIGHISQRKALSLDVDSLACGDHDEILLTKRALGRCLRSISEACNCETELGKFMFEQAVLRAVRLWSTVDNHFVFETPGLCYADVRRLVEKLDDGAVIRTRLLRFCAPAWVRATLLQSSANACNTQHIDRRYRILSSLLKMFAVVGLANESESADDVSLVSSTNLIEDVLGDCLPFILGQMILETNYEALLLTVGFKLFNLALDRMDARIDNRRTSLPSYLDAGDRPMRQRKLKRSWTVDLDHQLYRLAQAPRVVERMLPYVLQYANKRELLFLVNDVLKGKRDLRTILSGRDQLMLKGFVKELGQWPNPDSHIRAFLLAARAREDPVFLGSCDEKISLSNDRKSTEAASSWVQTRFMYLLVNVVQSRWGAKETWEKTEDLRALFHVLDFIPISDKTVAQCLPQMMSTLNGAIAQKAVNQSSPVLVAELRMWAVQCMSKFIKLVSALNWEIIGE